MKISAFTIVFNEEKHIERCLKSLTGVIDEIVLVHDGECNDKTLEIAKKYNAKILVREHMGMMEFHKKFAIESCKNEWVLQIDADEFLSKELQKQIRKLVMDDSADAYAFVWQLWNGKKYFTHKSPYKNVLFRKSKMYYFCFPHVECNTYGKLKKSNLLIEHRPFYNNYTLNSFRRKWLKWIKVHAKFFYRDKFDTYNCDERVLIKFQESIDKQKKYANPVLAPLWMIQSIVVSMLRHGYWKSFSTWKVALLQGLYGYYLCIYIWKYRK